MPRPEIGSYVEFWYTNRTVIAVRPYTGKYPQWFTWFVTVAANTRSSTVEFAL